MDSPLSGYGNTAIGNSPSASPLFQKAMNRDRRRSSYGSPSSAGLGRMQLDTIGTSTSKQLPRKEASVSLNNRWLYERSKGSPTLRSVIA